MEDSQITRDRGRPRKTTWEKAWFLLLLLLLYMLYAFFI